ncbi:hypothetical protein Mgra_00009252, partial [Meloidogyne graminicola]
MYFFFIRLNLPIHLKLNLTFKVCKKEEFNHQNMNWVPSLLYSSSSSQKGCGRHEKKTRVKQKWQLRLKAK